MKTRIIYRSLIVSASLLLVLSGCGKQELEPNILVKLDSLQNELSMASTTRNQLEANKKLVADFYQEVFGDKNIEAIDKYIGDTYIQHNPVLADGKDVLKHALTQWFKNAPKEKIDIHHLSAEGDLVYIHTKAVHEGKVSSIIDIFRLENNKIVEHWDVIQAVPEKSANPHPMF
jgi:predicted SnoaL-like aldol condensation-catalyzing enzyme